MRITLRQELPQHHRRQAVSIRFQIYFPLEFKRKTKPSSHQESDSYDNVSDFEITSVFQYFMSS